MAAVPAKGRAAAVSTRLAPEGEATRLLYERHQRKILSFCQHQLGNREEAEDATQITFLNAFRGLKRGTSPEFESAWLFKIAHNVCLTKQRNSYRRRLVEAPSDFELIEERVPAHDGDTDELFGLETALRVIPEQQRRALLLREWQGLSYKEIADEMRLSQAAIETLLFRARRSLAEALTQDPTEKRKRGRPRMTSNAGSIVAALKSLLIGGGVKVTATVATVAATSVVATTPAVRQDFIRIVLPSFTASAPAARAHVTPATAAPAGLQSVSAPAGGVTASQHAPTAAEKSALHTAASQNTRWSVKGDEPQAPHTAAAAPPTRSPAHHHAAPGSTPGRTLAPAEPLPSAPAAAPAQSDPTPAPAPSPQPDTPAPATAAAATPGSPATSGSQATTPSPTTQGAPATSSSVQSTQSTPTRSTSTATGSSTQTAKDAREEAKQEAKVAKQEAKQEAKDAKQEQRTTVITTTPVSMSLPVVATQTVTTQTVTVTTPNTTVTTQALTTPAVVAAPVAAVVQTTPPPPPSPAPAVTTPAETPSWSQGRNGDDHGNGNDKNKGKNRD